MKDCYAGKGQDQKGQQIVLQPALALSKAGEYSGKEHEKICSVAPAPALRTGMDVQ